MNTVFCLHIYRDGLHTKIAAGDRISGIGLVTIAEDREAALDYLTHQGSIILSQNVDGKYNLVSVQMDDGQHATFAIEECEVWERVGR